MSPNVRGWVFVLAFIGAWLILALSVGLVGAALVVLALVALAVIAAGGTR